MKITGSRTVKFFKITGMAAAGIAMAILFAFIFGWVFQMLWNWLMPDLFGLKSITYMQAFALVILSKILFGSFSHHHAGHHQKKMPWETFKVNESSNGISKKNWKYLENFWDEEGHEAFEEYLKKIDNHQNDLSSK